jgi:hypothetical protein
MTVLSDLPQRRRRVEVIPLTRHLPCNPSVIKVDGGYLSTVRAVNYDLKHGYHFWTGSALASSVPDTQNSLLWMDSNLQTLSHDLIEDRHIRADKHALDGLEDLRLFLWRGEYWVTATAVHYRAQKRGTVMLARLDGATLRIEDPLFFSSPDGRPVEKNWMPWVVGDTLYFVHTVAPYRLMRFDRPDLVDVATAPAAFPDVSGSSCVMPWRDGWLAVVHSKGQERRPPRWEYWHRFLIFDGEMRPKTISRKFKLDNDAIEFCAGLAFNRDHETIVLSYGCTDRVARFLELDESVVGSVL